MKLAQPLVAALLPLLFVATSGAAELPEDVVVRRGAASIDLDMVDARLLRIPANRRAGYMDDPERIELLLQSMLVAEQLAIEADELGIDEDPVIANELKLARAELLSRKMMERHVASLPMPDFEQLAKERYLSSLNAFKTKETRDLRHLVVFYRNHGVQGAKQRAAELLEQLKSSGRSFEDFAAEFSEEKGADKDGGLLEGVGKGDVDADFYDAGFGLANPGDIAAEPARSRYGYHLVQLVKVNPSQQLPFEEVKAGIIEQLQREHLTRARAEFVDNVKASAPLEANPDLVVSLRSRYLPAGEGSAALKTHDETAAHNVMPEGEGAAPAGGQ